MSDWWRQQHCAAALLLWTLAVIRCDGGHTGKEQPELPPKDATYCSDYVDWTTPGGAAQEICVTQDGRVFDRSRWRIASAYWSPWL